MRLYIFRHGETDWNQVKRLQGRTDIELNSNGIAQAQAVANISKDIHFDYCYSSPLKRAFVTAKTLLAGRKLEIVTDERLAEMCFGTYEGTTSAERDKSSELIFKAPQDYIPPEGGETFQELIARAGNFVEDIILPLYEEKPDNCVLISGHGAVNKALVAYFTKKDVSEFWSGSFEKNVYCAIVDVNGRDDYVLVEDFHSLLGEEAQAGATYP